MRLIDIQSLELREFFGAQTPAYAILSHRWGLKELNFKEVYKNRIDRTKQGYKKLAEACRVSAIYGVRYLWIDTCCIDKRSSAELSEAINSMFTWYKDAKICLAYLEDVLADAESNDESLSKSIWFTRCWTLQELLAPEKVDFFDQTWQYIGSKKTRNTIITSTTGIPRDVLTASDSSWIWKVSIAEKMFWASHRQATRPEDVAYSLMGIFGIHMPLVYGEAENAFIRLQEEIIRSANEYSFLFWGLNKSTSELLAKSPADFQHMNRRWIKSSQSKPVFTLNNLGLEVEAELMRFALNTYGFVLPNEDNCLVFIVRKSHLEESFHRVSVIEVPHQRAWCWHRRRKITIIRGTEQQRLLEPMDLSEVIIGRFAEEKVPLCVEGVPLVDIEPITFHADDFRLEASSAKFYKKEGDSNVWCGFHPIRPEVLRLKWHLKGICTLWLDFLFDFDSHPCLLLQRQTCEGQADENLRKLSVERMCELYKGSGWQDGSTEILKTVEQVPGILSYFCRVNHPSRWRAEIPLELILSQPAYWLYIYKPFVKGNPKPFWLITISKLRWDH